MTDTAANANANSGAKPAFAADARAYRVGQWAKVAWWAANGYAARRLAQPERDGPRASSQAPPPPPSELRRAWAEAFDKDAADVAAGLYPVRERVSLRPDRLFAQTVDFLADARRVDARRRRGSGVEVRADAEGERRPAYYRQNFHYQSGGWFTAASARRYEAQVEALFAGSAGPMRRRALSLLARAWRDEDPRRRTVLDVGCGSGAFLVDLRAAFPRAHVMGLDLSAPYLGEAHARSGAGVVQALAERLPFADATLDAVTCVFLFHELPPAVRVRVAKEFARVLKPGGVLAFADSIQASDAPAFARLLESFPAYFHEPFYASYQAEDLASLFARAGLTLESSDSAFLTKALLLRNAAGPVSTSTARSDAVERFRVIRTDPVEASAGSEG